VPKTKLVFYRQTDGSVPVLERFDNPDWRRQ
jgi:hypothetical protein